MRPTLLDPAAKEALRKTIRALRLRLIDELGEAAKGEYRLDVAIDKAQLPEARRCRRERLEAWEDEQVRGAGKTKSKGDAALRTRYRLDAVKEAAHTLVNRLVFLRILEHHGVLSPKVVTGGWESPAYAQEFVNYAGPLGSDDTRGYQALLGVVFAELALELPGLFGPVGLTALFPVPAATLREVVRALNDPLLATAWGDDTTLGWVYQYWNDPEREALDAKIAGGGKIEPHEIAQKTQMFTERYMVEWLLQNSLGLTWLALATKNGWTTDAAAVLPVLDARRAEFRGRRERGEVPLDALMPVAAGLESAWKYYVPQPIPEDAVAKAPASIRELKLLDPACGSGHFLVIAFDLLFGMYQEEARHRQEAWSDAAIAESILANNLHGIDIDARAIQIAAAGLWLKAKLAAPDAVLSRMNLVAATFRLGTLPSGDGALVRLCDELAALTVPRELTLKLVDSLRGVDHLGTLLRVDTEIASVLDDAEEADGPLFAHSRQKQRVAVEQRVAEFLDAHAAESDLGLRLEGEQLAAGLRFVRLVKAGTYDVVVGNPPYQGLSKTAQFEYVTKHYPRGKADLYAAFLERGLELAKDGGISALLTMRGWMFLGQFAELRKHVLAEYDLRVLGDLDRGAFEDVPDEVLATVMSIVRRGKPGEAQSLAMQPTPIDDRSRDSHRTWRKRAALVAQVGRYEFDPKGFAVIEGEPIVYWWTKEFLERYAAAPKLGAVAPVRQGMATGDNTRFLRRPWEVAQRNVLKNRHPAVVGGSLLNGWAPYIKGAEGRCWVEPLSEVLRWASNALEIKLQEREGEQVSRPQNEQYYFRLGVAFASTGSCFSSRAHRYASIFDVKGQSVFGDDSTMVCATMNSHVSRRVVESLNPTISFQVGDANRIPMFGVGEIGLIWRRLDDAFTSHESHREPSVEFKSPGPSPWRHAQAWAQVAVDRAEGAPLPPYEPELDPPDPEAAVSFAIGVALGRFGADGEGVLDAAPESALPSGILFVGPSDHVTDSLAHSALSSLVRVVSNPDQPTSLTLNKQSLRDWLRKDFFGYHKGLYENRPIYFPLSSEKRSFVAWVSIHRWTDHTLQTLLADHLNPTLRTLDGEIADLNTARASSDKKTAVTAEKQYGTTKKLRDELAAFIDAVKACAERGAGPTDPVCPPRATDAAFRMNLDDGVMINSAALWPLLSPQWGDPKKWWKQLCQAEGRKDYDWSHLARRYFPARVEEKCKVDPSLAVAHGCFWTYHPAKAYAWELRLKDEIREAFTIDEAESDECRKRFVAEFAETAREITASELKRRERKAAKGGAEAEESEAGGDPGSVEDAEAEA